jgi:hypothetical protein
MKALGIILVVLGTLLGVPGMLLCLTIVGIVIGLPLVLVGAALAGIGLHIVKEGKRVKATGAR